MESQDDFTSTKVLDFLPFQTVKILLGLTLFSEALELNGTLRDHLPPPRLELNKTA